MERQEETDRRSGRAGRVRRAALEGGELAALWGFAIAQPLFDQLKDGDVFVWAGWRGGEIVLFALVLALVPPLLLLGLELLGGLADARLRRGLHAVFIGTLAAVFCAYLIKQVHSHATWSLAAAMGVGIAVAVAHARLDSVRLFIRVLAPAPIVFVVLFLVGSPTSQIVFPREARAVSPSGDATAPVVMVVFDELPTTSLMNARAELDARSYPSFAALASDATWYRNATTVAEFTSRAMPAMLSGRQAENGAPASAAVYPDTIFTLLGASHRLRVLETGYTRLCPTSLCPDPSPRSFFDREAEILPLLAKRALEGFVPISLVRRIDFGSSVFANLERNDGLGVAASIAGGREPSFHFIHAVLPHWPWIRLPSGKAYQASSVEAAASQERVPADPYLAKQLLQRHLAQVRYADRFLGSILERLRETGLYDRALIVVTADHGRAIEPGAAPRALNEGNASPVMGVPLFIKPPFAKRGRTEDTFARTTDILPTIADVLGISVPWRMEGISLVGDELPERPPTATASSGRQITLDPRAFVRERDALARRHADALGSESRTIRPFALGPHRELVGKRVGALATARPVGVAVRLDPPGASRSVEDGSSFVPALVRGSLVADGGEPAPEEIAIAVEGRVVATTRAVPGAAGATFSALLPESALHRGVNHVSVYAISAGKGRPRLSGFSGPMEG